MTSFEKLEALNVEICAQTGAGQGANTTREAIWRYRATLVARQDEVRAAITAARADTQRYVFGRVSPHHYIDGIAAALTRALIEHHKRILPDCKECEGTGISLGQACQRSQRHENYSQAESAMAYASASRGDRRCHIPSQDSVMITFAPRTNQEREANRRVRQWHAIRLERGKVLVAESLDYLRIGDLRWIDQDQLTATNDPPYRSAMAPAPE